MYFSPQSAVEAKAFTWGLFAVLAVCIFLISFGAPIGPLLLVAALTFFVFCFRYLYSAFGLGILLIPFSGWFLSIPVTIPLIGDRAFGGSIDLTVIDVVLCFVFLAWVCKATLLLRVRRDAAWKVHPPLFLPFLALVFAHLLSAFSSAEPDFLLVIKYTLRPVLFSYLAWVFLPTHLIRSRRRLVEICGIIAVMGTAFALMGVVSMAFPLEGLPIGRARPLAIFGSFLLGDNQNSLSDILIWTLPLTLALRLLVRDVRVRRVALVASAIQLVAGIFTFTRTFWIAGVAELIIFSLIAARGLMTKHVRLITLSTVFAIPFAVAIIFYWMSPTAQSSNTTRAMLLEISWTLFRASPILGVGAGTFIDHVSWTRLFLTEFGAPLDSHGVIQKIGAETGIIGLLAYAWVWIAAALGVYRSWKRLVDPFEQTLLACLSAAATGAFVYQIFNTDYWSARLWLPLGILCAYLFMLEKKKVAQEDVNASS